MKKFSLGKQLAGCIIGLLIGVMYPLLLPMSIAVVAGTILFPLLYVWSGPLSAAVAALVSVSSVYGLYESWMAAGLVVLTAILPALAVIWLLQRRAPYFERMRWAIIAQFVALLAAIGAAYLLLQTNLVDFYTGAMKEWIGQLPTMLLQPVMQQFALGGLLAESEVAQLMSESATRADFLQLLDILLGRINANFKLTLPALLLTSSVLSGIIATVLPSRVCVRRGDEPACPYVQVNEWYVPNRITLGLAGVLLFSYLLLLMDVAGADALTVAIQSLLVLIFSIQAIAGLAGRMKAGGMPRSRRILLITLLTLLLTDVLKILGLYRCLFGRRGMVTQYMKKRQEKIDRKDDDI